MGITFTQLKLKNCVYFKQATLNLNTGHILLINGENLRSRERLQTNGAGKSLLLSYLPNILYANHPLGTSAQAKKELYLPNARETSATLAFTVAEQEYIVQQYAQQGKLGYRLWHNGVEETVRTTALAEKHVATLNPLSEAEFYTLVYLNSQRDFVFQRGKFEARLKFFTEFFRLDYYDQMREYFQAELKKVKQVEVKVSVYEGQRLRLQEEVVTAEAQLCPNLAELEQRRNTLKQQREALRGQVLTLQQHQQWAALRSQLLTSIGGQPRPTRKYLVRLQAELTAEEAQLELRQQFKTLKTQYQATKAQVATLKEQLDAQYQAWFGHAFTELYTLNPTVVQQYHAAQASVALQRQIVTLQQQWPQVETLARKTTLARALTQQYQRQQQVELYRNLRKATAAQQSATHCPLCQGTIDLAQLQAQAQVATHQLPELTAVVQYLQLTAQLGEWDAVQYAELQAAYTREQQLQQALPDLTAQVSRWQRRQREVVVTREQLQQLKAQLHPLSLEVAAARTTLYSATATRKLYAQLATLDAEIVAAGGEDLVQTLDPVTLTQQYQHLQHTLHQVEVELEQLGLQLHRHALYAEKVKVYTTQLAEVSAQISELHLVLADKEVLEVLIKVYSNKGLKLHKVHALCTLLETNLNHFKPLLFGENFKFSLQITEKSFDIIVDRGDQVISDVRNLSGSEGRRFNLLLLISLLPLTPATRRSNLVVLDEMEANGDSTTIEMFCTRYLPELHKYIPNIVVISPHTLPIPHAQRLVVVKDAQGSRLTIAD